MAKKKDPADSDFDFEEASEPVKPARKSRGGVTGNEDKIPAERVDGVEPPVMASAPTQKVSMVNVAGLPKKVKGVLDDWNKNRDTARDHYIDGIVSAAQQRFGHGSVIVGNEMNNLIIGIPCPALAFQYVIAQDAFPLSQVIHLNGLPNSNKSAMLYEFYRWFLDAGGMGNLLDTESKLSSDLLPSIVGYARARFIPIDRCESTEDWQRRLGFWLMKHKDQLTGTKESPGPGKTIPVLFGVDSFSGKNTEEIQEKVRKEGSVTRTFATDAMANTKFLKTWSHILLNWPFSMVMVNHLREGVDSGTGRPTRNTPGGSQLLFQESLEIEMKAVKSDIQSLKWKGRVVQMRCQKNSCGDSFRRALTRILWWHQLDEQASKEAGFRVLRQYTLWDWHWATVQLLTTREGGEAARLRDVINIKATATSDVENRAYCPTIGIKQTDAMSWSELGALIAQDTALMSAICEALWIKQRPVLQGDYSKQQERIAEVMP